MSDRFPSLRVKRRPPNFRRHDCCTRCVHHQGTCDLYDFNTTSHPDEMTCDDFRPDEETF